jgi:hypothetical protein
LANPGTINTGDGTDGAVTISAATNLNTDDTNADSDDNGNDADGVNFYTDLNTSAGSSVICVKDFVTNGLVAGDEILIINLKGTSGSYANVGLYEFKTIQSITHCNSWLMCSCGVIGTNTYSMLSFATGLTNPYDGTTQKIMVQRVPQYTNVTIDTAGSITATAWNGTKGGVVAFRASGTVTINNTSAANEIDVSGKGYVGGTGVAYTVNAPGGESYNGTAGSGGCGDNVCPNGTSGQGGGGGQGGNGSNRNAGVGTIGSGAGGGGGRRDDSSLPYPGGGGGGGNGSTGFGGFGCTDGSSGNGSTGGTGGDEGSNCVGGGGGGGSDGLSDSSTLNARAYFGGAGGAGGGAGGLRTADGGNGANGGGIIFISTNNLTVSSGAIITANGNNGSDSTNAGAGGAGAGGSIIITSNTLSNSGSISASAGTGGTGRKNGGNAGGGRTFARYGSFSGNSPTPNYSSTPYYSSGTYTSGVMDASALTNAGTFSWTKTDNGGSITMEIRGSVASGDLSGKSWCSITSGASVFSMSTSCVETNSRYFQYRATLNSVSPYTATPTLDSTTLSYNYYSTSQTLTSSPFDSSSDGNLIGALSWAESATSTAATTTILIRTASTSALLASSTWINFTFASSTCSRAGATTTCPTSALPSSIRDGTGDRWFQYKVTLDSNGTATNVLANITITYVVNAPPEAVSSASQGADGLVTVEYRLKDPDTASGTTAGSVYVTLEYCAAASSTDCANTGTANWSTAVAVSGAIGTTSIPIDGSWQTSTSTITWNPKADYNAKYYNNTYKVRIKANDSEAANNLGYGVSNLFTLDTTNPVPGANPILIQATSSPAYLNLSCVDSSTISMRIGTTTDLSGYSYTAYAPTSTININSYNPASTTVYVQFKDQYNNTTTVQSVATPETPSALMVQDTTNTNTNEYRLFMAWKVVANPTPGFGRYSVLKSEDNITFTEVSSTTDRNLNYYTDTNINSSTIYYYKLFTIDANNNTSFYSSGVSGKANGIQDYGEGGGGTDQTAPVITNVEISTTTTQSATIAWDTNEPSGSVVGYSTTSAAFTTETGVSSMRQDASILGRHSVTIINLVPSTTYYFQVKSSDPTGNTGTNDNGGPGYSFTTKPGPRITTGPTTTYINNVRATIVWYTDVNSNSEVVYSTSSQMANAITFQGSVDAVTYHSVTVTGLIQNTWYYYYVKSTDGSGNEAIDNNANSYYYFRTNNDITAPVLSNIATSTARTSATITWQTDEDADSSIAYGTSTSYGLTSSNSTTTKIHAIILSDLLPSTLYHFLVNSIDTNTNSATSSDYTFTTETFSLSGVAASSTGIDSIDINWSTNENASSQVEYATSSILSGSTLYPASPSNSTQTHSISLTNLSQNTTYYYRASSTAGSESKQSPIYYFTTGDTGAPAITNVTSSPITDTRAVITWQTDENASSRVEYGTSTGNYLLSAISSTLTKIHSLTLSSLSALTNYYYRVISSDSNSNTATSTEETFTTLETQYSETEKEAAEEAARTANQSSGGGGLQIIDKTDKTGPMIKNIRMASVKSTEATVEWETDEGADSILKYGTNNNYGNLSGQYEMVVNHKVQITSLIPQNIYNYKILARDFSGNLSESDPSTFTTLSLAEELAKNEEQINEAPTTPEQEKENSNILIDTVEKTLDLMKRLANQVSVGTLTNIMTSQFDAIKDLSNFIPSPIMSGEPKVEVSATTATISWTTDKEANSLVAIASASQYDPKKEEPYAQVIGKPYANETSHKVTVDNLSPDTLYHYQLRSKASVGPLARSANFTFKTKKESLSIEAYSVKSLSSSKAVFSWSTNIEADSGIKYTPYRGNALAVEEAKSKHDKAITTIHELTIDDLEAGIIYQIELSGKDAKGNQTSKTIPSFSTEKDSLPPQIYQVQTDSAMSSGKQTRVQTIISYLTDEPSTSRVYYQKGFGASATEQTDVSGMEKTNLDASYAKKHVIVITKFEPGQIYTFKVEATDSSGNTAISKTYTVLAPRQTETVFELIIKNFEQIFGWMKFVGG